MAKSAKVKKTGKGLLAKRNRAGYTFVIHWVIGLILFFVYPLVSSIWYAFNEVTIKPGSIVTEFKGLHWFKEILNKDPYYVDNVAGSLGSIFYSLPVIIALSLILAVMLNQKFKGRTVFRTIFFLPIIMAGSVVMNQLQGEFVTLPLFSSGESGSGIIDYTSILNSLNMPDFLGEILIFLLSNTISLVWSCGVQTILFLAGLQSIPDSFYEVSKIEGANRWEEFWRITVPSLRHIISLVLVYTMIELFTDMKNKVVSNAYALMVGQSFGKSSAMLWFYFAIVLAVIGTIYVLYNRYLVRKWE
ncbi:MAG: sugar ABC transporter permease [Faecalimonas sp.]|nr:sugar ABC transporter permease [Faecalimonas sp.]